VNAAYLREQAPDWEWCAVRNGFGWHYQGTRGSAEVVVRPVAVVINEDDFETRWVINEGFACRPLALWLLEHGRTDQPRKVPASFQNTRSKEDKRACKKLPSSLIRRIRVHSGSARAAGRELGVSPRVVRKYRLSKEA